MKRKVTSILMVLVLCLSMLPITSSAATNPYGKWQTIDGLTTVRCTYYAWQQAYDNTGVVMPNWGNAGNWYSRAKSAGYSVGTTAKAKSIAVWSGGTYGHVAYVVSVNGNKMTVNEGGQSYNGKVYGTNGVVTGATWSNIIGSKKTSDSAHSLVGFIYLTESQNVKIEDYYKLTAPDGFQTIRSSYSTSSSKVYDITTPAYVCVTQYNSDKTWGYVTYNGYSGWIRLYYVEAHTHSYGSWTTTKAATCTASGTKKQTCACGLYKTETIAALGHNYKGVITAPTCTEEGYTTYTCSRCNDSYTANKVEALGHNYILGAGAGADCELGGFAQYYCKNCGDTYSETSPSLGHDYEGIVTAPTCTDAGYTTYTCSRCDDSYVADETAALGHAYKAVVTLPTTTAQGYTTYTCANCGDSYKDDYTPALTVNGVKNMTVTATDTNIKVTWDAYPNATTYNLYVKNEEGTTVITRKLASDTTSYTLSWPNDIEWDKNYTVGVRVKTSKWLDTIWKDSALVVGNRIVDVKTESVGRTIKVTWKAYEGATQYYVHVYEKGAVKAFTSVKSTTNSATIINSISPEVDYEVKVVATKGVTAMKAADAISVDARLDVFTPDTFTERGITPNKAAVSWDEVRGAYKYWAYLTPVDGGATITRESNKAIATFSGLTPNTTYTVKVQVSIIDADGKTHYSGASEVLGTITTTDWEDINFKVVGTSSGAEFSWNVPTNACGYIIYRSTNGGKTYKKLTTLANPTATNLFDTTAKNGYIYGIVVQLKDDYVTTKSAMTKAAPIVK